MAICEHGDCEKEVHAKNLCSTHYARLPHMQATRKKYALANKEKGLANTKRYYKKTPGIQHRNYIKMQYGLTAEEYQQMLDNVNHKCEICGVSSHEHKTRMCVDHDHKTGHVRGILCKECNSAIGFLADSPELLSKAIDYLKKATNGNL